MDTRSTPTLQRFTHILLGTGQTTATLISGLPEDESIAVIEGSDVGGSCVNTGCTPTKTLVASAKVLHQARRGDEYGVRTGRVDVDFDRAMARMNEVRHQSRDGLAGFLESRENVTVFRGWGSFVGPRTLEVGEQRLTGERVYINVGARPSVPPVEGLDAVPWLDNERLLELTELPEHLVILGASYVALELGQVFRRFGSQVTAIEAAPRILGREDEDVAAEVRAILEGEGIEFIVDAKAERVERDDDGVAVVLAGGQRVVGSHLLVATGRQPNSDRLDPEAAGVEVDDRGYIQVDEHLRTTAEGVYALGDVNGQGAFTHTSVHDAQILLDHLQGGPRTLKDRDTIYTMFVDPPLGRVGLNEAQARERGHRVLRAVRPMSGFSRAREMGETQGFVKVLVDADTGRFLGAAVLGVHGDEVIALFALALSAGLTTEQFRRAVFVHPTIAEQMPFVLARLEPLDDA